MSASEGTANSPGADARANAPGGTAQQAAVRDQLRAKLRFEGLALKALCQETTPWARQKQYLSLRDAVAAGEQDGIAAAKKRCRLAASDLRSVCAYVQKQYNDAYEAARAAFGQPVDGKDPLCTLVLEESKRYVEELLGNSQCAADGKDSDSARGPAAASAGTAAHTSVDHASADHESQPVDKSAQGSAQDDTAKASAAADSEQQIPAIEAQLPTCGYTVVKPGDTNDFTQDDAGDIDSMAAKLYPDARFNPIFQGYDLDDSSFLKPGSTVSTGDRCRLQANIHPRTNLARKLSAMAKCRLKGVTPGDFVFLGRKPGCTEQHSHRDAKYGAFLVYALTDNYTLRVWDETHLPVDQIRQRMQDYIDGKQVDTVESEGRLITLQKGEFAIIHGCCVHAGGPASTGQAPFDGKYQDLGIHCYLDDDTSPEREKNATYPVVVSTSRDMDVDAAEEYVTLKQKLSLHLAKKPPIDSKGYRGWRMEHRDWRMEHCDMAAKLLQFDTDTFKNSVYLLNVEGYYKETQRDAETALHDKWNAVQGKWNRCSTGTDTVG